VLLINPNSGGGTARRVGLVEECRARGIEPRVVRPGDDLTALAEAAVAAGADAIGMAGGDGSLALVAGVAARSQVPLVVVPAGTRNHFAMDLGLDRADVVGALDAYGAARERAIDLGDVDGRPFVNNVSLGLYAQIIRTPAYRDAKLETALSALPGLLGPGSAPSDLRFTDPAGTRHTGAHVVQVSNNRYGPTLRTIMSRPRLDSGRLGVITLELPEGPPDAALVAALAGGHPERLPGYRAWESLTFEVDSGDEVDCGVDGEALRMPPPLRFTIRPGALRIRVPPQAGGRSPAARELDRRPRLRGLLRPSR
jgi:diacylglycerol kinase family enzyme